MLPQIICVAVCLLCIAGPRNAYQASRVSRVDQTLTIRASGSQVVEAVTDRIKASCIFDDDKLLLRRLAYVESNDGKSPNTFRKGYFGGIWQVDEAMYEPTKEARLRKSISAIQADLNIDWMATTWQDLLKPMYSGLAARLYIQYMDIYEKIPRSSQDQAEFWKSGVLYLTSGDEDYSLGLDLGPLDPYQL